MSNYPISVSDPGFWLLIALGCFFLILLLIAGVCLFLTLRHLREAIKQLSIRQGTTESHCQILVEGRHQQQHTLTQEFALLRERLLQMPSDLRDPVLQWLSVTLSGMQERMERSLQGARQEQAAGLQRTTTVLEQKFLTLEKELGLKLEAIRMNVETRLTENLQEGFRHFEKVQQHLQAAEAKLAALGVVGQSITDLNQLLRLPHLRGGFGDSTLERLLSDFLPAGGFEMQYCIVPDSSERVDAVVRFVKHLLPIDSKFPREQVLPLFESARPEDLAVARKKLAEFIRVQSKSIATKYIRPEHGTLDMALLFLPSETLYFEVVREGALFEQMTQLKVFPVSPNTLAIALRSVTLAQEYYAMAQGVGQTIEDIKRARRHFGHFDRKFGEVGKGIRRAQEAYEMAHTHLGHYESSIFRLTGSLPALETPPEP